jgi:hypothetical protein
MTENRPFGFDPEDFDRTARALGEGIRDTLRGIGKLIDDAGFETVWETRPGVVMAYPRRKATTGDTGDGVWAIVLVAEDGTATVEQVHATELDALRANKANTDPQRRVRFLPYGIAVGALDDDTGSGSGADVEADVEPDPEH